MLDLLKNKKCDKRSCRTKNTNSDVAKQTTNSVSGLTILPGGICVFIKFIMVEYAKKGYNKPLNKKVRFFRLFSLFRIIIIAHKNIECNLL